MIVLHRVVIRGRRRRRVGLGTISTLRRLQRCHPTVLLLEGRAEPRHGQW